MLKNNKKKQKIYKGFTIIELLVVIVIIAILAALIFVAYNGVQRRATVSMLQANLSNCKKSLELYKVEYGIYPTKDNLTNACKETDNNKYATYTLGFDGLSYVSTQSSGNVIVVDTESTTPTEDTSPYVKWFNISAGNGHNCAISYSGIAYCWGDNGNGRLGDGTTTNRTVPTPVIMPSGKKFISISAITNHTCAISTDNLAYCWGYNTDGGIGDNTTTHRTVPTPVIMPSGKQFMSISAGSHTCAITNDSLTYCWGSNSNGQLGDNTTTNRTVPTPVTMPSGKQFMSISAGINHTCATTSDNLAYCWGYNNYRQLGDNTTTQRTVPTQVTMPSGKQFMSISAGYNHTCAMTTDNLAYCWGQNGYDLSEKPIPTLITMPTGKQSRYILSGGYHTCTITTDKLTYCWGSNSNGQLGDNTSFNKTVPTQVTIPSGKKFISISSGGYHTCAITSDNLAYCWGRNNYGQLGDTTTTQKTVPTAVSLINK